METEQVKTHWYDDKTQLDLCKRTFCAQSTADEFAIFVNVCKRTGLDPFARQIYATYRKSKKNGQWTSKQEIQSSIDGFRVVAERSGEYQGQTAPLWCGEDGHWTDVWLKKTPPAACKIGVHRKEFKEPLVAVARFESYAQYTNEEGGDRKLAFMWAKMPDLMVSKCCEALALRKAFPQDLSGLYTSDEMAQAGNSPEAAQEATPDAISEREERREAESRANGLKPPIKAADLPKRGDAEPDAPTITNWQDVIFAGPGKNKFYGKRLGDLSEVYLDDLWKFYDGKEPTGKDAKLIKAALVMRCAEKGGEGTSKLDQLVTKAEAEKVDIEMLLAVAKKGGSQANDFFDIQESEAAYLLDNWADTLKLVEDELDNLPK